jgi:hypothetical protein
VKDENGNMFADSNHILNRLKNYLSQQLNIHKVNGVNQNEMHTNWANNTVTKKLCSP